MRVLRGNRRLSKLTMRATAAPLASTRLRGALVSLATLGTTATRARANVLAVARASRLTVATKDAKIVQLDDILPPLVRVWIVPADTIPTQRV